MALTTQEEALVRRLLEQQAAILSLAGNEATITSKLGATKVTLADLVAASGVADADLLLTRQGTTDKSVTLALLRTYAQAGMATQLGVQVGAYNTASAGGTADALTASFTPAIAALENGLTLFVRAAAANTTTTPTFAPDGLTPKTIVKGNNLALAAGDIAGAGHWLEMNFDTTLDKWVLQNPYSQGLQIASTAETQQGSINTKAVSPQGLNNAVLGMGQTWQNVTSSRSLNTTYTNATERAILVALSWHNPSGAYLSVTVAGQDLFPVIGLGVANIYQSVTFVVPPGATYSAIVRSGSPALTNWSELR